MNWGLTDLIVCMGLGFAMGAGAFVPMAVYRLIVKSIEDA